MPRYSTASASDTDHNYPSLVNSPAFDVDSAPHSPLPSTSTSHPHHQPYDYGALPTLGSLARADGTDQPDEEDEDDDDEEAWDEVDIPQAVDSASGVGGDAARAAAQAAAGGEGIEVVISKGGQGKKGKGKGKPGTTLRERMIRQERHKVHILSLMAMAVVRNRWLNDAELQARLLSLVPLPLLTSFTSITRQSYPNPRDRSRLFDRALQDLISWWCRAWEVVPEKDLRRRGVKEVEEELEGWKAEWEREVKREVKKRVREQDKGKSGKGKEKAVEGEEGEGEVDEAAIRAAVEEAFKRWPWEEEEHLSETKRAKAIASQRSSSASTSTSNPTSTAPLVRPYSSLFTPIGGPSSWEPLRPPKPSSTSRCPGTLHAAATVMRGSHDLQAQLFVALLRAIDVPARLVVSLQGVEWRSEGKVAPKKTTKGKGKTAGPVRGGGKGKKAVALKAKGKKAGSSDGFDSEDDETSSDEEGRRKKGKGKAVGISKAKRAPPSSAKARSTATSATAPATGSKTKPSTAPSPLKKPTPRRPSAVRATSVSSAASTSSKPRTKAKKEDPDLDLASASDSKPSHPTNAGTTKKVPETIVLSSTASASSAAGSASDTDHGGWVDGQGKLNYKVPKITLRGGGASKGGKAKVAQWKREMELRKSVSPDPEELATPPTQWIEAYTRYNKEWITVDPSRKRMRCRGIMEPKGKQGGEGNVLAYVVAFEEDGSAHDVTPRYAHSFTNVTLKLRVPTSSQQRKANDGGDWFSGVLKPWARGYQLNRDKEEQEELWKFQRNEPFPTSMGGFKNHPNFVLEPHLHRDEALLPSAKSLGLFKGVHKVFRRSDVLSVKSKENWYRQGRAVKEDEIPRKWVKQRAVTIYNRRREELAKMDGLEQEMDQGLFDEGQTEVYVPPPVIDGKVPKNDFGNIDLFVPSMLPAGAVHLPNKVAAKCAKELGLDYAEAIMGFEFRQRRALPIIAGIVVAEENAETLREAILTLEQSTLEKELAKQQDRVMKRWKKLIQGLRIRQRLMDQFGGDPDKADDEAVKKAKKELSATSSKSKVNGASAAASSSTAGAKTKKRTKREADSPPLYPSATTADTIDSDAAPPPRKKRVAAAPSSTSKTPATKPSTRSTRSTRSSAAEVTQPEQAEENGRSLRIRVKMPAAPPAADNDDDENERQSPKASRRPPRASAVRARGRLKLEEEADEEADVEEEDDGEEDEDEEAMEAVEPVLPPPPSALANGHVTDAQLGGGFLPEAEEGVGSGGFIPEDEDAGGGQAAPGGFIREEAGGFLPEETGKAKEDEEDYGFEYEDE
ncbi:hypothetical protein JCM11251_003196 [Rhodosporidiobolus azoricus]